MNYEEMIAATTRLNILEYRNTCHILGWHHTGLYRATESSKLRKIDTLVGRLSDFRLHIPQASSIISERSKSSILHACGIVNSYEPTKECGISPTLSIDVAITLAMCRTTTF